MSRPALLALCLLGCAAGGDPGSGDRELPNRGFAPYAKVIDEEEALVPVLTVEDARLDHPSAVLTADGEVALFVEVCPDDTPCHLARADSPDGLTFGAPTTVLEDDRGLHAPFAQRDGDAWTLWMVVGDGAAIARATGDGRTFGAPVEVLTAADGETLGSPSFADGALWLQRGEALARAPAEGDGFGAPVDVYTPCADDAEDCWPTGGGLQDPEVRLTRSATGRALLQVAFAGGKGRRGLGFAASEDGLTWSPFRFNPSLDDDSKDERAPTVIRRGDAYLLYFVQDGRRPLLGVAVNDAGKPSATF